MKTEFKIWAGFKGQLISKANSKLFIWTKKQRKYFCISALASKMGQIIKIMAHYHANYISSIICNNLHSFLI